MQLDRVLQAAEADRQEIVNRRDQLVKEVEDFRKERLAEIGELDAQIKRIDRVIRAATGGGTKRSRNLKPGDADYKYRQVGLERLQRFANAAAKMKGQFTRSELTAAVNKGGERIAGGQDTYAARDLIALGWLRQIDNPSREGAYFLEWAGPPKHELAPLVEPRINAHGREQGWQFKDAATRKRAGMEA